MSLAVLLAQLMIHRLANGQEEVILECFLRPTMANTLESIYLRYVENFHCSQLCVFVVRPFARSAHFEPVTRPVLREVLFVAEVE